MRFSASKCFTDPSDKDKSASNYINRKKAKQIYKHYSDPNTLPQNIGRKTKQVVFKGPVFLDHAGNLAAIGGLNNRNYELMNSLVQGKYYSKTPFIYDSSNIRCFVPGNPKCNSLVSRSLCAPPNKTYQLYEGPYYTHTNKDTCNKNY